VSLLPAIFVNTWSLFADPSLALALVCSAPTLLSRLDLVLVLALLSVSLLHEWAFSKTLASVVPTVEQHHYDILLCLDRHIAPSVLARTIFT